MFYCDTSFVAPLILPETTSNRIEQFVQTLKPGQLVLSWWTKVEFSSLVSRLVRMKALTRRQAQDVRDEFNTMLSESYEIIAPRVSDYGLACELLEYPGTGLRAGDALHLAIARNRGAEVVFTLDKTLIKAARKLGMAARTGIRQAAGK